MKPTEKMISEQLLDYLRQNAQFSNFSIPTYYNQSTILMKRYPKYDANLFVIVSKIKHQDKKAFKYIVEIKCKTLATGSDTYPFFIDKLEVENFSSVEELKDAVIKVIHSVIEKLKNQ